MRAITLWQPWASFIAIGIKPFETRGWQPPRGLIGKRIAIHAAKRRPPFEDRLWGGKYVDGELPLGAIVCTARLAGAYQCGRLTAEGRIAIIGGIYDSKSLPLNTIECDEFGDYSEGRWAWWLTDIERLDPPIPASGKQGIWNWQETQ